MVVLQVTLPLLLTSDDTSDGSVAITLSKSGNNSSGSHIINLTGASNRSSGSTTGTLSTFNNMVNGNYSATVSSNGCDFSLPGFNISPYPVSTVALGNTLQATCAINPEGSLIINNIQKTLAED